ncbi:MAG TPA: antibiotic biosynthesis monooxygenase [Nitrososphaeraceae archaeon]|nr:antibiotic biosynthesis monooxygenase [Nitrososphaeraceae archaeon]
MAAAKDNTNPNTNNKNDDLNTDNKHANPVTVIVKRIAKNDKIKEFEEWLSGISKEVSKQEGNMGIDIIRPTDKSKLEYVIIFRFNNYDSLTKWEKSTKRNEWLQKGRKLVEADPDVQKLTGLEFWFTPYFKDESSPMIPLNPPPRYKMVIVTIPVISIMLMTLVPQIHILTEMLSVPFPVRLVIALTITVLLMTYVIMPLLTKLLKFWLFKT